jgi:hypothetical protein
MNTSELLGFITPQPESLQLIFFILIVTMFVGTVISTHLNAKDASWEKNWNNGTSGDFSDELDIDHGSVTDLWHAVETKSEKLAEIMPSMLLVVGLLGTFLGLGLALNHASNILGQSNVNSAVGTANNMQDLLSMMQGLGTKFKTSTWGIIFFLLLKVWSSWLGFDEKRLAWVIRKVKAELERRKAQERETETKKQQTLFEQINQAAGQIVQGFALNLEKLSEGQKAHHQQTLQFLEKGIKGIQAVRSDLANINTVIQSDSTMMKQVLEQSVQSVREDLASINVATQDSSKAIAGFVMIINDISAASNTMADGAHKVGLAGNSLVDAVDEFSTQFKQVLGDVRTDLSAAINDMSTQAAQTLEQGTRELGKATREITVALGVLSRDVTTTMNGVKDSIGKSLEIQERGSALFVLSSKTLNENVIATTELVNKLGEDIRSGLQAVSDSGRRMASIGKSLETIVPKMGDLLPALEPLKTLHVQHLPLLEEAKTLRADLLKRDSKLELHFEKSLKIQQEGVERFQKSTDTLNQNITATAVVVQKLSNDIHSGLQAVSDSGLRMASMGKSLETVLLEVRDLQKEIAASPIKPRVDTQS